MKREISQAWFEKMSAHEVGQLVGASASAAEAPREFLPEFGMLLSDLRRDRQWTAAALAGRLGVSAAEIERLEAGHAQRSTLERIVPLLAETFAEERFFHYSAVPKLLKSAAAAASPHLGDTAPPAAEAGEESAALKDFTTHLKNARRPQ